MKIFAKVKQAGKRRNIIGDKEYILAKEPETLKDLITQLVIANVDEFNNGSENLITHMTDEKINQFASIGKVGFGERKNNEKQQIEPAIENALTSFGDGLYYVFINEKQIQGLDDKIGIKDGDTVRIIKLIMLSGRLW